MNILKGEKRDNSILFNSNIYLILTVLLIYFTLIGNLLSPIISFIYSPIIYLSEIAIKSINEKNEGFRYYVDFKDDYLKLLEKVTLLEELTINSETLKRENIQLKNQLKVKDYSSEVLQVSVLEVDNELNTTIINKGLDSNIAKGDVAYIGNMIVGVIKEVQQKRSKVVFINNSGISIKGAVISKKVGTDTGLEMIEDKYMQSRLAEVVIVGKGDHIIIENVPFGKVKVGDIVVVSDQRYDHNYIVGYIDKLDQDLAKATQTGKVKQYFDRYSLSYYYINK